MSTKPAGAFLKVIGIFLALMGLMMAFTLEGTFVSGLVTLLVGFALLYLGWQFSRKERD